MRIKKKHLQVTIFSSIIIVAVIVTTLIGQSLYIQWKKDTLALRYRNSMSDLTADIFRKQVPIINAKIDVPMGGVAGALPLFVGSIKNNSEKTVTSMLVEITFLKKDGSVAYKGWMHPLGENLYGKTEKVLLPGEVISFRHPLRGCSKEVLYSMPGAYVPEGVKKEDIRMKYKIKGMSVI